MGKFSDLIFVVRSTMPPFSTSSPRYIPFKTRTGTTNEKNINIFKRLDFWEQVCLIIFGEDGILKIIII